MRRRLRGAGKSAVSALGGRPSGGPTQEGLVRFERAGTGGAVLAEGGQLLPVTRAGIFLAFTISSTRFFNNEPASIFSSSLSRRASGISLILNCRLQRWKVRFAMFFSLVFGRGALAVHGPGPFRVIAERRPSVLMTRVTTVRPESVRSKLLDKDVPKLNCAGGRIHEHALQSAVVLQADRSFGRQSRQLRVFNNGKSIQYHRQPFSAQGDVKCVPLAHRMIRPYPRSSRRPCVACAGRSC